MKAIDLFAGCGGSTTGAISAGVNVLWAANHWDAAVSIHKKNHPYVLHACQDLQQADWRDVPVHDLLLASPECKGHTKAKGKEKKHHDASRSTAWAVVDCLEYHDTDIAVIENVKEFVTKWVLYSAWKMAMEALGYSVAPHLIDAADCGVPQNRERVFIICTKSKSKISIKLERQEHIPVSSVIEWDRHKWSKINKPGRSKATLARIKRGRSEIGDTFVMPYYSNGSGLTGRSIDRPIGTITTCDRWALVRGDEMRMFHPSEYRAVMGFDAGYILPDKRKDAVCMLGNAVPPPMMADVINAIKKAA
ncbi:MAG TPA: DNA cytosine methyltransferase [Chromatiales bacterium]|nr:DNA cytosine methyltransferase [Chromatiales bacterium]HEX22783.1 DNA cytosine methyltransferase [Chromatiales bacterium]